jgi:transmembrane 9 superfamily member 2/4
MRIFRLYVPLLDSLTSMLTSQVCPATGRKHGGSALISGASVSLNLGEVLRGDRIVTSDYELNMAKDNECTTLCTVEVDRRGVKRARDLVKGGYVSEWIVDNLPGATSFVTVDKTRKYYASGFKLGYKEFSAATGRPKYYINNHLTLVIRWRKAPGADGNAGRKVIVGFEVFTKSVSAEDRLNDGGCPSDLNAVGEGMQLYIPPNVNNTKHEINPQSSYEPPVNEEEDMDDGATLSIPYSYSVYFREDNSVEWANRWDLYFVNQENSSKIHWLAIFNSLVICVLLSAVVGVILARTIRGDIKGYKDGVAEEGKIKQRRSKKPQGTRSPKGEKSGNGILEQNGDADNDADVSSDEESFEDITGWKLLHGDVFRPPPYGGLLAPVIGSGMQLVFMAGGLLTLSCFGILNPSWRGGFVSVGFGLFIFAGVFSGYFSGRIYKTFGGQNWKKNTMMTAILFPGLMFTLVFILNLFVWAQASSTAIPFTTLLGLGALWLFCQLPLVYVGSWYGYTRSKAWEHPTKTNVIPRQIPLQQWYLRGAQGVLLAGLIPFAVIFIELLFVFKSIWQDKSSYYYMFGFLALISVILIVTVIEITIVTTYFQLCSENYDWWWQSFFVGAGSAFWIFAYSMWYYFAKLHIQGFVSSMLFFSYSFLACVVYGLLTGTIGFLSAYAFVRRIYG